MKIFAHPAAWQPARGWSFRLIFLAEVLFLLAAENGTLPAVITGSLWSVLTEPGPSSLVPVKRFAWKTSQAFHSLLEY